MKYRVQVVQSYWQNIVVEADNEDEAEDKAFEAFNVAKANKGEGQTYRPQLIKDQS